MDKKFEEIKICYNCKHYKKYFMRSENASFIYSGYGRCDLRPVPQGMAPVEEGACGCEKWEACTREKMKAEELKDALSVIAKKLRDIAVRIK